MKRSLRQSLPTRRPCRELRAHAVNLDCINPIVGVSRVLAPFVGTESQPNQSSKSTYR